MTSFDDLDQYAVIPRVTSLRLSPDGSWLAAVVQTAGRGGQKNTYVSSIWRISPDPAPGGGNHAAAPARLTRSAEGESAAEFLPDGSLLFTSRRPGPPAGGEGTSADGEAGKPGLWLLPAAGGEARQLAAPPGGVTAIATAAGPPDGAAAAVAIAAPLLPGAAGAGQDASLRKTRKDAGVTAILHESGALRYWDHDLGPDSLRLLAVQPPGTCPAGPAGDEPAGTAGDAPAGTAGDEPASLRDLTPDAGRALDETGFEVTPDGSRVVTGWWVWDGPAGRTGQVHVIDAAAGQRQVLLASPGCDFSHPRVSPDGRWVACFRETHDTYDAPGDVTVVVAALGDSLGDRPGSPPGGPGSAGDLLPGFDRRPKEIAWAPDSGSLYVTADDQGRSPLFTVSLATGGVTRLTADDGAYGSVCPSPDGQLVYALRSSIAEPPTPVRLPARGGEPERLAAPGSPVQVPGRVTEIAASADDGVVIRAWLVLPEHAAPGQPAPLVLWAHGGPLASFAGWSWRWNPWILAAAGYAVLMPDPALSTGYGHDFIVRGHGQWGQRPYTDLMAITDAAEARDDIDAGRTAMMGGSFGGYMASWIAGHTSRFRAIVSHAGLWSLGQMFATTDLPPEWRRTFGDPASRPERYLASSPDRHAANITTPMLVIHGDKDYRVPVGEALRLWWDLQSRSADVRFLYFPDENHWILTPGNAAIWYRTVLAFLACHVLGQPWQRPDLL